MALFTTEQTLLNVQFLNVISQGCIFWMKIIFSQTFFHLLFIIFCPHFELITGETLEIKKIGENKDQMKINSSLPPLFRKISV